MQLSRSHVHRIRRPRTFIPGKFIFAIRARAGSMKRLFSLRRIPTKDAAIQMHQQFKQIYKCLLVLLCCSLPACSKPVTVASVSGVWGAQERSLNDNSISTKLKCEIELKADGSFTASVPVFLLLEPPKSDAMEAGGLPKVKNLVKGFPLEKSEDYNKIVSSSGKWSIDNKKSDRAGEIVLEFETVYNNKYSFSTSMHLRSASELYFILGEPDSGKRFTFIKTFAK
ncbi:MAG: hypothetical protein ACKVS6_04855 [Planctomycetota bacterium]